mmetsp:Transcript_79314/g.201903  ORF Transcript_79314/g.201903 Transcript_79314/m.201903 type:complete len:209 (-) Transcript_79314:20-646(-)
MSSPNSKISGSPTSSPSALTGLLPRPCLQRAPTGCFARTFLIPSHFSASTILSSGSISCLSFLSSSSRSSRLPPAAAGPAPASSGSTPAAAPARNRLRPASPPSEVGGAAPRGPSHTSSTRAEAATQSASARSKPRGFPMPVARTPPRHARRGGPPAGPWQMVGGTPAAGRPVSRCAAILSGGQASMSRPRSLNVPALPAMVATTGSD